MNISMDLQPIRVNSLETFEDSYKIKASLAFPDEFLFRCFKIREGAP